MILDKQSICIGEVQTLVKNIDEKPALKEYVKKFAKLSKDKADKLAQELRDLKNPKIRQDHIVKLVDFVPKDAEELNKILNESLLTEDETNAILEITRKY